MCTDNISDQQMQKDEQLTPCTNSGAVNAAEVVDLSIKEASKSLLEHSTVKQPMIRWNGYDVPRSCTTEVLRLANDNGHPRDKFIVLDEGPHKYYIKGKSAGWTSVTSFVDEFFAEFDKIATAQRIVSAPGFKTDEKYLKYQSLRFEKDGTELKEEALVSRIVQSWKEKGDDAAQLGTKLHRNIELFYNGLEVEDETREWKHFDEFRKACPNMEPFRTEWMVYSEEEKICGSIDMVMTNGSTGELFIFDWKRIRKLATNGFGRKGLGPLKHLQDANFIHYSLQLSLYQYILETYYGVQIAGLKLVVLHPSNESYKTYDAWNLQEEVRAMLKQRSKIG